MLFVKNTVFSIVGRFLKICPKKAEVSFKVIFLNLKFLLNFRPQWMIFFALYYDNKKNVFFDHHRDRVIRGNRFGTSTTLHFHILVFCKKNNLRLFCSTMFFQYIKMYILYEKRFDFYFRTGNDFFIFIFCVCSIIKSYSE